MSKAQYPVTQAIRFLREHQVDYVPFEYDYVEKGGTEQSAKALGVAEHIVIKTIVLQSERKEGLVVLMHGDKQISTRNLARQLGMKHIEPAKPEQANKWTGYMVGGTSPFGLKKILPVYAEKTIFDLERFYINGGKKGFLVAVGQDALLALQVKVVEVATE